MIRIFTNKVLKLVLIHAIRGQLFFLISQIISLQLLRYSNIKKSEI
jgi:hypothetical protein